MWMWLPLSLRRCGITLPTIHFGFVSSFLPPFQRVGIRKLRQKKKKKNNSEKKRMRRMTDDDLLISVLLYRCKAWYTALCSTVSNTLLIR
jgi:hypothetical protein